MEHDKCLAMVSYEVVKALRLNPLCAICRLPKKLLYFHCNRVYEIGHNQLSAHYPTDIVHCCDGCHIALHGG